MNRAELNGLYLVVDPSRDRDVMFGKVRQALDGGAGILQVWDNWPDGIKSNGKRDWIEELLEIATDYNVPVLINRDWELMKSIDLHGVHFDTVPDNIQQIRDEIGRPFIAGVTCGNNLDVVDWADENSMDYLSFCAMFPSPSIGGCEIVQPDAVRKARERSSLPLFLSGGITPGSIGLLSGLDFDGVAVISGIINAKDPGSMAASYLRALNNSKSKS